MNTVLALVALAIGLSRIGLFVAVHVINREYNIIEHAVSDYAVGSTKTLSSITTWLTAALWPVVGVLAWRAFPTWPDLDDVLVCLILLTGIFVALPFLPTDVEGQPVTIRGRLHLVAAVAWFALAYRCMNLFAPLLSSAAPGVLAYIANGLSKVATASLAVLIVALVVRPLRRWLFGISERVFLLSVSVFFLLVPLPILAA